ARLWKELCVEPGLRFGWIGTLVLGLLVLASFLPAVFLLADFLRDYLESSPWMRFMPRGAYILTSDPWLWLRSEFNEWVRIAGSGVVCLMLIGIAVRAAGSLSGERARQTLDSLLTTPLESGAILGPKWLSSILSVRWGWLWLGAIWLLGLAVQSLHVLAVPLLAVAWLVYAGGCAVIGLWFSLVCRTTLRATVWTLVTLALLAGGHWV